MTSPIDPGFLGYQPTIEPLKLTTGATFVQTIQLSGGAQFLSGTTLSIVLTAPGGASLGTPWQATLNTALTQATWTVPNAVADAIPANSRYTLFVTFPGPIPTTYAWYEGSVIRT